MSLPLANLWVAGGFLLLSTVLLHLTTRDALTLRARRALIIMMTVTTAITIGYLLSLGSPSPLANWLFAFNSSRNIPHTYNLALFVSVSVALVWLIVTPPPRTVWWRIPLPLLILAAYPLLRYVLSDTVIRTPEVMLSLLMLVALDGVIAVTLSAIERQHPHTRAYRWIAWGNAVIVVGVLATYFPAPQLGYLTAQRVNVDFGAVTVVGYRVNPAQLTGEAAVTGEVYWRVNAPLTTDYNLTLTVYDPASDSAALAIGVPLAHVPLPNTRAAIPGVLNRTPFTLADVPTVVGPGTLRLWLSINPVMNAGEHLPIVAADVETVSDDTAVLVTLPALPPDAPAIASKRVLYRFDDGIELTIGTLAIQGRTVQIPLWWSATETPNANYTQFLHVYPPDSTQPYTFDTPPFKGALPTGLWWRGMVAHETRIITLPEDAPAGEYSMYTGLYDSVTVERLPARDGDGLPAPDAQVLLGRIPIE